ncbi:aldehyde dehydrogenase family protein [Actinocorallia sp. API 0066]|uniref:aldehyde dehydrogenase family protein n=1 Tax=Actinocorallia sp. API 0066 TaxID=2896846 RepID=UPI001E3E6EB4|nr:aldehyde dehydrogenase family protein [Actinocorallia sp. API 0066]MCD0451773.1 aldehyde dehydrogenase family protein [Actinocorallia sp. API 0066]
MNERITAAHWINGRPVPVAGPVLDVVNPATGEVVASVPWGTAADVDAAVAAASAALPGWAATPPEKRAAVLRRVAAGLRERGAEIAATITAEMGAPITLARTAQATLPVLATEAAIAAAEDFPWTEEVANSLVVREPIGVVGAITPWNFPLQQLVTKVVPALLAGNTVVLKPSEIAPLTARIFAETTADAGLPAGVLNVVHGTGPVVGEAITTHPGIDMVSFTGSTAAGRRVTVAASETVKRVALELGGKAAHIILPDADLEEAVLRGLAYAWTNAGQACGAWSRMLVPEELHDRVVEILREAAAGYTVGDPTDPGTAIGPVATEAQRRRVDAYIQRGIADGATLVVGGPGRPDGLDTGAYVQPTIFARVDPDSVIAQEEIFGPVLMVIPYTDEDHAVEIANGTVYGLNAAVAGSPDRATAVARRLRVGQVAVNAAQLNFRAPFGGYKQSGNGRELGREGLAEFLETKAIDR